MTQHLQTHHGLDKEAVHLGGALRLLNLESHLIPADASMPAVTTCCTWPLYDSAVRTEAFPEVEEMSVSRPISQNLQKCVLLLKFSMKPPILCDPKLSPAIAHSVHQSIRR